MLIYLGSRKFLGWGCGFVWSKDLSCWYFYLVVGKVRLLDLGGLELGVLGVDGEIEVCSYEKCGVGL